MLVITIASNISEGYYTPVTVNNNEPAANVDPKASVVNVLSNSLISLLMSTNCNQIGTTNIINTKYISSPKRQPKITAKKIQKVDS